MHNILSFVLLVSRIRRYLYFNSEGPASVPYVNNRSLQQHSTGVSPRGGGRGYDVTVGCQGACLLRNLAIHSLPPPLISHCKHCSVLISHNSQHLASAMGQVVDQSRGRGAGGWAVYMHCLVQEWKLGTVLIREKSGHFVKIARFKVRKFLICTM